MEPAATATIESPADAPTTRRSPPLGVLAMVAAVATGVAFTVGLYLGPPAEARDRRHSPRTASTPDLASSGAVGVSDPTSCAAANPTEIRVAVPASWPTVTSADVGVAFVQPPGWYAEVGSGAIPAVISAEDQAFVTVERHGPRLDDWDHTAEAIRGHWAEWFPSLALMRVLSVTLDGNPGCAFSFVSDRGTHLDVVFLDGADTSLVIASGYPDGTSDQARQWLGIVVASARSAVA